MTHRVYFNRGDEYPFSWSVDEGTQETEVTVMAVIILPPCVVTSDCMPGGRNRDTPSAWFTVEGNLEIFDNIAYFN